MENETRKYPKHACQHCGAERKYVETVIDDEFFWSKKENIYQPNGFTDMFEHTGNNRCAECEKEWTGT